jgi:hypothetical protein
MVIRDDKDHVGAFLLCPNKIRQDKKQQKGYGKFFHRFRFSG